MGASVAAAPPVDATPEKVVFDAVGDVSRYRDARTTSGFATLERYARGTAPHFRPVVSGFGMFLANLQNNNDSVVYFANLGSSLSDLDMRVAGVRTAVLSDAAVTKEVTRLFRMFGGTLHAPPRLRSVQEDWGVATSIQFGREKTFDLAMEFFGHLKHGRYQEAWQNVVERGESYSYLSNDQQAAIVMKAMELFRGSNPNELLEMVDRLGLAAVPLDAFVQFLHPDFHPVAKILKNWGEFAVVAVQFKTNIFRTSALRPA